MKKLVNILLTLLVAGPAVGFLISSCADESDCSTAGRPMMRCVVYSYERKGLTNDKDTIPYLTVTALRTDSTLINRDSVVTKIDLPLRYTADSTVWVFHYNLQNLNINTDTIIVFHQNTPYFTSMDCGYEMKQSASEILYTTNKIDSIHLRNANTNTDGTENLKIYFTGL